MQKKSVLEENIEEGVRRILVDRGMAAADQEIKFEYEENKKGSHVRTNSYVIVVTAPVGLELFCKEYINTENTTDLSKREKRLIAEEYFAEKFETASGFAPVFFGTQIFTTPKGDGALVHNLKFTEGYDFTLENRLSELFAKKEELRKRKERNGISTEASKQLILEMKRFETRGKDWLKRFIDVILINDHKINQYPRSEIIPRVRQFDSLEFADDIVTYYNMILKGILPNEKRRRLWKLNHRSDLVIGSLIDHVVEYIGKHSPGDEVSIFGSYPAHCLAKKDVDVLWSSYERENLLQVINGETPEDEAHSYTGFAVCDLTKMGTYNQLLGIASLLTNPAVTRLIPDEDIKPMHETRSDEESLLDHVIVVQQTIQNREYKAIEEIDIDTKKAFSQIYARASVWALMRSMYFIASLEPERRQELVEVNELYQPESFVRYCITGMKNMYDPARNFSALKEGFEDLEKALMNSPLSS